ncbi:peptidylprolyl isomerase [Pseudoalteromonas mariniglutinosa]|uniref:peptidylprolyl isomerase n=1 Tax=Pseudoalteromonas mariniglutinosa TaxID=206042 RepID=UPI00384A951C
MKKIILASLLCLFSFISHATVVEMQTSQGTITIHLFDQHTPKTVNNFLAYIGDEAYDNTVIHRSVDNFVIQGGGFTFTDKFTAINTLDAVSNEPVLSNVKGTIAMAKQEGNADSATSQWFFNLKDNSSNLDRQNGGFTVFGQISTDSYAVVDAITELQHCGEIPVVNLTAEQCADSSTVLNPENLVTINKVLVLDDDPNSSADLTPTANTLINEQPDTGDDDSSSGSMAWLLALLGMTCLRRKG